MSSLGSENHLDADGHRDVDGVIGSHQLAGVRVDLENADGAGVLGLRKQQPPAGPPVNLSLPRMKHDLAVPASELQFEGLLRLAHGEGMRNQLVDQRRRPDRADSNARI